MEARVTTGSGEGKREKGYTQQKEKGDQNVWIIWGRVLGEGKPSSLAGKFRAEGGMPVMPCSRYRMRKARVQVCFGMLNIYLRRLS